MTITEMMDALAQEARDRNPGKPDSFFANLDYRLFEVADMFNVQWEYKGD